MLLAMLSPTYVLIILVVALLIFGRKLPEIGRSLGKGIVEFKKGLAGIEDDFNRPEESNAGSTGNAAPKPPQPLPKAPEYDDAPRAG